MHRENPKRPAGGRWPRRILVAVLALGVAYVVAVYALSRLLDPVRLADWAQPRLATAVNRDVEIGTADVHLLPFEVRLGEVAVSDPTGLAGSLATVGTVALRVRLLPLLRREVRVDRISIVDPVIDLRVGPDGTSNFGDMSPAGGAPTDNPPERRPVTLELSDIRVEGGVLRYSSALDSVEVTVSSAAAESSVRREAGGPWLFRGRSDASVTLLRARRAVLLDGTPLALSFDAQTGDDFEELLIREGSLSVEGIAFALGGRVNDLKEPVRSLAVDATLRDLPIQRVLSALPDSVRARLGGSAEGTLSADLTVRGRLGPDVRPEVTGTATLTGGRVTAPDGVVLAQALEGRVTLAGDGRLEPEMRGEVLGGPMSLGGHATLGSEGRADLTVRAKPDLGRVVSLVELPDGVTLSGAVDSDLRISGPLGRVHALSFDGTIGAEEIRLTHPALGVPVTVPSGTVRLAGTRASFSDIPIRLGSDRLIATGELRDLTAFASPGATPYLTGSVRGEHLSLVALRATPPADTALTYGRVAFARVGGRTIRGLPPEDAAREMGLERPDSLPIAGALDVALDRLDDRRGTSEDVRAHVEFGPRFVRVTEATLRRYGGKMSSGFDLTLGETSEEPFTLALRVQNVDAGTFLASTTPLGRLVRGTFTLEIDLTGSLDALLLPNRPSLVGTGRFLLQGGGLSATPLTERLATFLGIDGLRAPDIREWRTSFVLEDGTFRLADGVATGAPGTPRVGGAVGLDGALDLVAAFSMPASRLDASALQRLGIAGEVVERLRARDDVVEAVLRIGGDVLDPNLRADTGSPVRTLASAAQEEAKAEVQEQIQERRKAMEERATGFLRGLLQRRDTARAAPDSLRRDTVPPDTVRKDTVPPDTVPKDTIPPDTIGGARIPDMRLSSAIWRFSPVGPEAWTLPE